MTQKALVTAINDGRTTVIPMLKDACSTCTSGCAKQGIAFEAKNPRNLPVKEGSVVVLAASRKMQVVQGLFALLVPFLSAVAGFFAAGPILKPFGITAGDGFKSLFVLSFLIISSALVFFITRKNPLPGTPEILEIL